MMYAYVRVFGGPDFLAVIIHT